MSKKFMKLAGDLMPLLRATVSTPQRKVINQYNLNTYIGNQFGSDRSINIRNQKNQLERRRENEEIIQRFSTKQQQKKESNYCNDYNALQGGKGNVDKEFYQRIMTLLKIAIPSWKTKEFAYIVVLTGLLVVRTIMSIWLADVQGQIVKAIVNRNVADFFKRVN